MSIEAPLQRLLGRLQKVRSTGTNRWMACCSAHNDRNPSLSISQGDDRVLIHCFAGCAPESVVKAVGLTMTDLFDDYGFYPDPSASMNSCKKSQSMKSQIEETYDYTDDEGKCLFQVARYEPKSFRQRRPDGNGCWIYNVQGVEPTLYRRPETKKAIAAGKAVFVVEGERDVHTVEDLGLTATTAPMGAGKWRPSYTSILKGAEVAILPDNDDAGRAHAEKVAAALTGEAASVKVVLLPDLEPGEDVSDWVKAGGTERQLLTLVEDAPLYDPSDDETGGTEDDPAEEPEAGSKTSLLEAHEATATFPDHVIPLLPEVIKPLLQFISDVRERDVFIAGVIALLSGCLPNVWGRYDRGEYAPNLYVFVSAPAGSGKGTLNQAMRYVQATHKHVLKKSRKARAEWEKENKSAGKDGNAASLGPKPPERWLVIPGNTSASALLNALAANGGLGIFAETEADTVSQTLGQEWGTFTDVLRKSYAHERVSKLRVESGEETDKPCLSMLLSGTPNQVGRLIPSIEDGLWSRFCFYAFLPEAPTTWRDVTPKGGDPTMLFATLSQKVLALYKTLEARQKKLSFKLLPRHWQRINEAGQDFKQRIFALHGYSGVGVAHRMGISIFRIAMVLAVWRRYNADGRLSKVDAVTATDEDLKAALAIAKTFAQHSEQLMRAAKTNGGGPGHTAPEAQRHLYRQLPQQFQTGEAVEVGASLDLSERTVKRHLSRWCDSGKLVRVKVGHYRKP